MENRDFSDFITTLKTKSDIVDVASRYVTVERKGQNYWACCPFHHEKTPSFVINQVDQYFHCFGCGKSGDVIKFVQEIENVEFKEAVAILAEKAGITIPELVGKNKNEIADLKKKKDRLQSLLRETATYYHKNLYNSNAKVAMDYLNKRGIKFETVRKFGIGYSLGWTDLIEHLEKCGFTKEEMKEVGVAESKETKTKNGEVFNRYYDVQAGRLIIPIFDYYGQVCAFGGRILEKNNGFAKYKNTKETIMFSKSKTLYAYNFIKKEKINKDIDSIIVVEGYMDAISLWQAGFNNVVASMGTSLTSEQANMLGRISRNIYISYDGDSAGVKAALRGLDLVSKSGLNVKVVCLPDKKDPDDIVREGGRKAYQNCIDKALPLIDFKLKICKDGNNLLDATGKRNYILEALKIVGQVENYSIQEELLKGLSRDVGISVEALKRDLYNFPKGTEKVNAVIESEKTDKADAETKAMRVVVRCLMNNDNDSDINYSEFIDNCFNSTHKKILEYLKKNKGKKVIGGELFDVVDETEKDEIAKIIECDIDLNITDFNRDKYFFDSVKTMKKSVLNRQKAMLLEKVKNDTDRDEKNRTLKEIERIIRQIKSL